MKKGILVYNKEDAEKNQWFINRIIELASDYNMSVSLVIGNDALENECDFAIVRNRDWVLSRKLEEKGIKVFNNSQVTKVANDKWETYEFFKENGVAMMYTQRSRMPYPFVLKPRDGHGGAFVYLISNIDQYMEALNEIKTGYYNTDVQNDNIEERVRGDFIYQLVASDKGKDLRVYVLGRTILTSMLRESSSDFRANFSLGGTATEVALSDEEMKIVAKVTHTLQSDFIGIDLIYNNGSPVLNEIEDAVGTRMLYKYTDIDACLEYVRWIAENLEN